MHHLLHSMRDMMQICRDSKGATAIEYGLIAALIAIAAITAMTGVGNKMKGAFNNVSTNLKSS